MLGFGAGVGVVMAAYSYSGGLRGEHAHEERDEVERKWEEMRKYRSPIEETIAEIGEGRGKIISYPDAYQANISRNICPGL